ncbi:uncharacterized protein LOC143280638 [Babylonia areolata]|uniref:uncharacterized protein LOC143280638 n=1 Tax=Babylonia areolata TaxID=304850 RepID=UPI003FCF50EF
MKGAAVACLVLVCWVVASVHSVCINSQGEAVLEGSGPYIGLDHCNSCLCQQGHAVCTTIFCTPGHYRCMGPDHRVYTQGQTFLAADGCNTCTCAEKGNVVCTQLSCAK